MSKRYYTISSPSRREQWIIRSMIVIGVISIVAFFFFFFQTEHRGYLPLYVLLCIVFIYGACRKIYLWYHYFSISVPKEPKLKREWTVDVLTTYFPGEPYEMTLNTLRAIQEIKYPHTTYLCDEANDPFLIQECKKLGVIHVTRNNRVNAKAGNINNALKQATGEICVILDPDHIPQPNFLNAVLPYFEDDEIGFVQVVQGYYNKYETLVARGAAEQTFQFYGPMMMTMNSYGTVNAIGANCTFRRAALNSIGGHAPGLAEDMHTAMLLHANGWKSVYVPKFLAKGLVPADLTSYYKQQLKWSRGTFELLYAVYPKLYSRFTLRQKIHYALLPFHYFVGFVYLLAFLIPVLSLMLSKMPWTGNIFYFIGMSVPIYMSTLLIRTYIQKWVIEENERGFHLIGGILQIVSWWVYLLGIVYTLIRKKIPYLPTPKNEQSEINYKILLPNLLVALLSIFAILYGLRQDFTPFTIVMAIFAAINALFMLFSFYLSFSMTNRNRILRANLEDHTVSQLAKLKRFFRTLFHGVFNIVRPIALPLLIFSVVVSVLAMNTMRKNEWENVGVMDPNYRDFRYLGTFEPIDTTGLSSVEKIRDLEQRLNTQFKIISIYLAWGDGEGSIPSQNYLSRINENGSFPMITWEPWSSGFSMGDSIVDLTNERRVFEHICDGLMDEYIEKMALALKENGSPVFLRFAHEFDNPAYPWSKTGENTPDEFKKAWRYVHGIFAKHNVKNVMWVWNPWKAENAMYYYPGDRYVDWIGTTLLNYGRLNEDGKWYGFEELYRPFHDTFKKFDKPVMLAEFGSLSLGGNRKLWFTEALRAINENYDNIKGIVFFRSSFDKNIPQNGNENPQKYLDWSFDLAKLKYLYPTSNKDKTQKVQSLDKTYGSENNNRASLSKIPSNGISYKKPNNWTKNYFIASKEVLLRDFENMKALGIDMINFEHSKIYSYNVLKYAGEKGLKVIYSFWLPDGLNFTTDSQNLNQLKSEILETIRKYKDDQTIVGWNIGNDLWENSGNVYEALSIGKHQEEYLSWLKGLAREIKKIDSKRPLLKELTLSESSREQVQAICEERINFDAVGLSIKNAGFLRDFEPMILNNKIPYYISSISVEDYVNNVALLGNVPIMIENWQNQRETGRVTFDGLLDFTGEKQPQFNTLANTWSNLEVTHRFPQMDILRPAVRLFKGRHVRFSAVFKDSGLWGDRVGGPAYKLSWFLVKNDAFGNAIAIKKIGEGNYVDLEIPEDHTQYKLRLTMSLNGFSNSIIRALGTPLVP